MKNKSLKISFLVRRMSRLRIGQRLVIGMMTIITIMGILIIFVSAEAMNYQRRYNDTLENLNNISYIIQETEQQSYRILDYCTMDKNIEDSGETEIIVHMLDLPAQIRQNIGTDPRYQKNMEQLDIVENLLSSYAKSYQQGAGKCGKTFSVAGDMDFYSMVDTADFLVKNCNRLLSLEMNRSMDLKNESSSSFHTMLGIVGVIFVVMVLMMTFLVYAMTESITHPLGVLMAHMKDISDSGLLDVTAEASITKTELEEMT